MRTYKRIHGSNLEKHLVRIIERHDRLKNSFFWTPPCHASARRSMEKKESESVSFKFGSSTYRVDQAVSCSCANVYYSLYVEVNGTKRDVRAIKRLVRS